MAIEPCLSSCEEGLDKSQNQIIMVIYNDTKNHILL